ncbi:MAG: hypothetical protein R3240_00270 [Gammaproteobacteria bacterium]|nr:hypothetical protein [Gammaproteobacteria bacterium]
MTDKVCAHCGYVGKPVAQEKDSFLVDIFAWGMFLSLSGMSQQWYLMFVPLAWTIYHIVNFNSACPKCKNLEMKTIKHRHHHA